MQKINKTLIELAKQFGLSEEEIEKYKKSKKSIILHGADAISAEGFTIIPNFVLRHPTLSPTAKIVFSVISSYAYGSKNNAFPGQKQLAKDIGLTERTIRTAIQELQRAKLLLVIRRGLGKTNVYVINIQSIKQKLV